MLKTISYFKNLIIVENFFCVSRQYLLEDKRTRLICDSISIAVSIIVISIVIMDLVNVDLSIGFRILEFFIGVELFGLALGSRFRKNIFGAIERLDDKCGVDEDYGARIQSKTTKTVLVFLPSLVFDFFGLTMLEVSSSFAVFLCIAFAAHDAEMAFASLLIESINIRLEKLKNALPNAGSRVHRHILIATAHISEQYTPRLLLLLGVTLITTVAYDFILVLADTETKLYLYLYLIWRESRSMYSLWTICAAAARSDIVCNDLALHLAGRLAKDKTISKEKNRDQHKTVQRWYSIVISQRPRYISGSMLSIGFSTPILVMDLSINYMLIIVQMYLAYK